MSSLQKFTLSNGVRVLVTPNDGVLSAALGVWCTTGSRHERTDEAGITHFIEHMLFKGTPKRNAKQIAEEIEGRGGILNAFTDKEQTCYYCRVLADDVPNSLDVLSDMVLNSLLDPEEIARECGVILEEIKRGEDEPSDQVHETSLTGLWGNHPLGKPVIGTKESVSSFRQGNFREYMERRYVGSHIVVSVAGNVDAQKFLALAEKAFEDVPAGQEDHDLPRPVGQPGVNEVAKDIEQVHFCISFDGVGIHDDPDTYTISVMDSVLGGGMSSRLFQEIRERRGLAYSVGSYTLPYSCGGAFSIYGGTSKDAWPQVQELVRVELDKLIAGELDDVELGRIKRQICGNLVLQLEGMNAQMSRAARNEIHHHREIPLEETLMKINRVSREDVIALAGRLLTADKMRTTAIGPF